MRININTDELVGLTNKLEAIRKSALPNAVKGTLNTTAFRMKTVNMPRKAKQMFEERQPNFFKANSRFEKAEGVDMKSMVSTVGFVSSGLHNNATNHAVQDLEQQEHSGTIEGRSFKPLQDARRSGTGTVKPNARLSNLLRNDTLVKASNSKGRNKMQQMIKAVRFAGKGGFVLATMGYNGGYLFKVKSIKRIGKNTRFEMQKLYSFKKDGVARVKATGFMKAAAIEVQQEMTAIFKQEAQRQIEKVFRK